MIKNRICLIVFCLLFLFNAPVCFAAAKDTIPPRPNDYIYDPSQALKPELKQQLSALAAALDRDLQIQLVTAVVPDMGDETIENYANLLFGRWGLGYKNSHKGILFIVALAQRKMRIEVGYGLEEAMTDGQAGELLDRYVIPSFKAGNLSDGIASGHVAIAHHLAQFYQYEFKNVVLTPETMARSTQTDPAQEWFTLVILLALFYLFYKKGWLKYLPFLLLMGMGGPANRGGFNGFSGGGFGGFGGGMSGGGGGSRGW